MRFNQYLQAMERVWKVFKPLYIYKTKDSVAKSKNPLQKLKRNHPKSIPRRWVRNSNNFYWNFNDLILPKRKDTTKTNLNISSLFVLYFFLFSCPKFQKNVKININGPKSVLVSVCCLCYFLWLFWTCQVIWWCGEMWWQRFFLSLRFTQV